MAFWAAAEKDTHALWAPRHRRKEFFSFFHSKDSSETLKVFKSCRQLSKVRDKCFKGQKGRKRDNRGWREEKASQLRAAVGCGAAQQLLSSALTFHMGDIMGHGGTQQGLRPCGQIWGYCREKEWSQEEGALVLPRACSCSAGRSPAQHRPPSAAHTGPAAPTTPERGARCAVSVGHHEAVLVWEASRGLPHQPGSLPSVLTFSSLSGTVSQCARFPKTPLSTPSPDAKLARRCAGWIQGSGRHPLEGAPNFTSLGLGYIG